MTGKAYLLKWKNMDECHDVESMVQQVFQQLIDQFFEEGKPQDRVGVEIRHPSLDKHILVPFTNREKLTGEKLLLWIEKVQQSKEELNFDDQMVLQFTRITPPAGNGWSKQFRGHWDKWYKLHSGPRGCIHTIENQDNLCLARQL